MAKSPTKTPKKTPRKRKATPPKSTGKTPKVRRLAAKTAPAGPSRLFTRMCVGANSLYPGKANETPRQNGNVFGHDYESLMSICKAIAERSEDGERFLVLTEVSAALQARRSKLTAKTVHGTYVFSMLGKEIAFCHEKYAVDKNKKRMMLREAFGTGSHEVVSTDDNYHRGLLCKHLVLTIQATYILGQEHNNIGQEDSIVFHSSRYLVMSILKLSVHPDRWSILMKKLNLEGIPDYTEANAKIDNDTELSEGEQEIQKKINKYKAIAVGAKCVLVQMFAANAEENGDKIQKDIDRAVENALEMAIAEKRVEKDKALKKLLPKHWCSGKQPEDISLFSSIRHSVSIDPNASIESKEPMDSSYGFIEQEFDGAGAILPPKSKDHLQEKLVDANKEVPQKDDIKEVPPKVDMKEFQQVPHKVDNKEVPPQVDTKDALLKDDDTKEVPPKVDDTKEVRLKVSLSEEFSSLHAKNDTTNASESKSVLEKVIDPSESDSKYHTDRPTESKISLADGESKSNTNGESKSEEALADLAQLFVDEMALLVDEGNSEEIYWIARKFCEQYRLIKGDPDDEESAGSTDAAL